MRGGREECITLLDGPDRFLTQRRTPSLALETVHECLIRCVGNSLRYENETVRCLVYRLENLEEYIRTDFQGCCLERLGEAEEHALLVHMGRGVEIAERVARGGGVQQKRSSFSNTTTTTRR